MPVPDLDSTIGEAAARADSTVFAHALDLDTGAEAGYGSDEPVVSASVFKVPVLVEYVRQVAAGVLDPGRPVTIPAGTASAGSTGLSVFLHDTTWAVQDLATSMITVSDNGATDIIAGLVGLDRVNAMLDELGLPATRVVEDCRGIYASVAADVGSADPVETWESLTTRPDLLARLRATRPEATNRTTPRESTRLLEAIWTDRAATPEACAEARRILGLQVWVHRLSSGFPGNDVTISAKTGTIGVVRNEIGVIEFRDGRRIAVAVFVRTREFLKLHPAADLLIGEVARHLVAALR